MKDLLSRDLVCVHSEHQNSRHADCDCCSVTTLVFFSKQSFLFSGILFSNQWMQVFLSRLKHKCERLHLSGKIEENCSFQEQSWERKCHRSLPLTERWNGKRVCFYWHPNPSTPHSTCHKLYLRSKENGICVICNFLLITRSGHGSHWKLTTHKTFTELLPKDIIYQQPLPNCRAEIIRLLFHCVANVNVDYYNLWTRNYL